MQKGQDSRRGLAHRPSRRRPAFPRRVLLRSWRNHAAWLRRPARRLPLFPYDRVVNADNADGKLLPGMTANATINVASAPNALVVPLTALHARGGASSTTLRSAQNDKAPQSHSPWGGTISVSSGSIASGQHAVLLVQRNGKLQPVRVQVGLITATQAAVTPVNGSTLSEGDNVVTAFTSGAKYSGGNASRSPLQARGPHARVP